MDIVDIYFNRYHWDRFIRPGSTVIDVGAHSGDTAVPMQYLARGTVLAIEPNPSIRAYLELNCAINSHLGVFRISDHAVTTQDSVTVDILDHCNSMCNGGVIDPSWSEELKSRMLGLSANRVSVQGSRLDTLLQRNLSDSEIENISFIKLDTEGHDFSILKSSRDLIRDIQPVIFAEWFFGFTATEIAEMFSVIDDLGYVAYLPDSLTPAATSSRQPEDLLLLPRSVNPGDFQ